MESRRRFDASSCTLQIRRLMEKKLGVEEGTLENDDDLKGRINKHVETIISEIQVSEVFPSLRADVDRLLEQCSIDDGCATHLLGYTKR
jgi:hypothetical protein